jgi:Planctomycete cytochrome C
LLLILFPPAIFAADTNSPASTNAVPLPPPADVKIDFARDIKPILDDSCIRCHGPEKPRSHFRLDSRDAALKGGSDGVDILPGQSAASPLIRYVAGLDPDTFMPPTGKGQPLTTNQIALLRAWIDQGVPWETVAPPPTSTMLLAPFGEYTAVSGNAQKYREQYWQREGANGGLDQFEFWEQTSPDTTFSLSGRLAPYDYNLLLQDDRSDVGYIHAGWNQYRKYFDNTGGYDPLISPTASSLGRDLYLDVGRGWADFGLTLPGWPQMVLGYEYQYRQGYESTTSWGTAIPGGPAINPVPDYIQEHTHVIKFDLDGEFSGTRIEDNFRGEFYLLEHSRTNQFYTGFTTTGFPNNDYSAESYHYFQGANTIRLERQFTSWLFGSAGYLYSKLDAIASVNGNTTDTSPTPQDNFWQSQGITLSRESHVGNINAFLGPWSGLTFSGGVQAEWTHEDAFGNADLLTTFEGSPIFQTNVQQITSENTSFVEESVAARYSKIPFTTLFAEAQLRQEQIDQSWDQAVDAPPFNDPSLAFDNRFTSRMYDWRAGFNTSPLSWASLSAHYRRYDDDSHYDVNQDIQEGAPNVGYPGFITARDLLTDEIEARLSLRPARWLKTTFAYKLMDTDYRTTTYPAEFGPFFVISPGGTLPAGQSDVQVYSFNAILVPWQRLSLSGTFSLQRSSTVTDANGSPAVEPYRGDIYSALGSAAWAINRASDLLLTYSFSKADFSQDNFAAGLPLGIQYQQHALRVAYSRRLSKAVAAKLQYGFSYYDEPSSGGANNYRAHSILAMLTYRMP